MNVNPGTGPTDIPETRTQLGFALVEMMISIMVISLLMIGIMDAMALCRRAATATQNQLIATIICQELMDAARDQSWNTLVASSGTTTMSDAAINRGMTGAMAGLPSYLNRPLMTDALNNQYSSQTWAQQGQVGGNLFHGNVTQTIDTANAANGQIVLTIRITWPPENGGSQMKSLVQSTVLSPGGVHN